MSPIVRAWVALAAIGAGIIHLALVIGAPLPLAVAFGALGFVEFAWGVVAFAREPVAPRVAIGVGIAPALVWGAALAVRASWVAAGFERLGAVASTPLISLAVATLFELFVVAVLGARLRRAADGPVPAPGTAKYLLGICAGALVVAALTAPALAATEAGLGAPQHGPVIEEPGMGH